MQNIEKKIEAKRDELRALENQLAAKRSGEDCGCEVKAAVAGNATRVVAAVALTALTGVPTGF